MLSHFSVDDIVWRLAPEQSERTTDRKCPTCVVGRSWNKGLSRTAAWIPMTHVKLGYNDVSFVVLAMTGLLWKLNK